MKQLSYENENQRRIGDFLIDMNILSSRQVLSIILSGSIPDQFVDNVVKKGITLSQLKDLIN